MNLIVALSTKSIIHNIITTAMWGAAPVLCIVFFILCIVQIVKVKKTGARKTKAIVFGCISGYFLEVTVGEIAFIAIMASAIAHM